MKSNDYINIQGWMVSELNLKGNELILFALIHGYSKDGINEYRGSKSYISSFLSISQRSVVNLISKLEQKGFIYKTLNTTGNRYKAVGSAKDAPVQKMHSSSAKDAPIGSAKDAHNINNNNNQVNIDFDGLLNFYNKTFKRKMRVINDDNKKSYKKLLKTYKKEDIINAMKNAKKDSFHLENGFKYLTIEYFSRTKTIDRFGFLNDKENQTSSDKVVVKMEQGEFVNF